MTEQKAWRPAGPRPPQVTVAAGVAVAGSVLLVLSLFDSMSSLSTVAIRQMIGQVLADSGHPDGASVAEAVRVLHDLMLVAGGTAAAAAVLAVYALFRHRGARIGLTIAAGLLLVTVVSGVLGVLVACATAMLWTRPARDWFAGRAAEPHPGPAAADRREPAEARRTEPLLSSAEEGGGDRPGQPGGEPARGDQPAAPGDRQPGEGPESAAPPPTYGFGTPHAHQAPPPYPGNPSAGPPPYPGPPPQQPGRYVYPGDPGPAYPPPGGWPPPVYGHAPRPVGPRGRRPTTVTVAAVLTWLFSAIAMAGFVIAVAMLLADRNQVIDAITSNPRFRSSNLTENQLVAAFWVACAVMIFWCAAAMVLAFLAFRGHNWARITLVVSAAASVLFGISAFPVTLAHMLVAIAVIVLLFTGGANDWFAGRSRGFPPPYAPPPGSGPPSQDYGPPPPGYGPPPEEQQPPRNVW